MGYKSEKEVQKRVEEHYNILKKEGYEIVFVAHQGSWNYGLGYEGSDVDTKAVVLPSLEDIVLNKAPVSFTKVLENDEHIDVKDIRVMFEKFKKQNINFLEILFSKFNVCNSKYGKWIDLLFANAEKIAHFNKNQALRCMAGMSMEKLKALQHPYPTIKDKIEKYGYDNKQLHHILRMNDFIKRYGNGEKFVNCLIPNNKEYLIEIKSTFMDVDNAVKLATDTDLDTKTYKDNILTEQDEIDTEVAYLLDDLKYQVIKQRLKEEIDNGI